MATVFVDEIDKYCSEVEVRGATIELRPADQPYGMRDFVLRDPDGNLPTFSCPLPE